MQDNGKTKVYVRDDVLVVEHYATDKIDAADQQWVIDAIAPHFQSAIPLLIWKRARYVLAPEAMKLIAGMAPQYRGEVVYAGSDAVPDPNDNFSGSTYLRVKAPRYFATIDEAFAYLRSRRERGGTAAERP